MRFSPWHCPECGACAQGHLVNIPGIAQMDFDERGVAEYSGYTEMLWDEGTDLKDGNMMVLVCSNGHEWKAELVASKKRWLPSEE